MGDKDKKKGGMLNFTKEGIMPNFLAQMAGGSGAAPQLDGIEGAMRRHAEREERDEREDNEDEAPLVVDEADALTAKERKKMEAKPGGVRSGGSLRFKDENSAAARFADSAHERVVAEERRNAEEAERIAAAEAEAEAQAAAAGKKVLFKSASSSSAQQQQKLKGGGKRSRVPGGDGASAPKPPKAVKNTKLLSFEEEDE